ncbi:MAG: Spy/CpxP family protein refolding chaperone [Candidatus Zixiibacteriota bacterium]
MRNLISCFLLINLFIVTAVLAQTGFGRSGRGGFGNKTQNPFGVKSLDRIYDKRNQLNLSDEQVEKIKYLIYEFRMAQTDRKAAIEKSKIKLRHLKSDKTATAQSIMDAIDERHRLEAERDKALYHFRNDVRTILTDEQIKKLEKLQKSRKSNAHRFLPPLERELIYDDYLEGH